MTILKLRIGTLDSVIRMVEKSEISLLQIQRLFIE